MRRFIILACLLWPNLAMASQYELCKRLQLNSFTNHTGVPLLRDLDAQRQMITDINRMRNHFTKLSQPDEIFAASYFYSQSESHFYPFTIEMVREILHDSRQAFTKSSLVSKSKSDYREMVQETLSQFEKSFEIKIAKNEIRTYKVWDAIPPYANALAFYDPIRKIIYLRDDLPIQVIKPVLFHELLHKIGHSDPPLLYTGLTGLREGLIEYLTRKNLGLQSGLAYNEFHKSLEIIISTVLRGNDSILVDFHKDGDFMKFCESYVQAYRTTKKPPAEAKELYEKIITNFLL